MMKKMRKFKKIAALGLAGMLACSTLVACVDDPSKNKTILNIKVFNGGLGYKWLQELATNFQETFKNVSFEEGKTGVYIAFTPNKEFSNLASNMAVGADAEDIYYTSDCNFYNFMDVEVAYNVTDIMTADVYDEDGMVSPNADGTGWKTQSKSIADRITVEHTAKRLNVGSEEEPEYYALPFDDSTAGIIVDWDLFKEQGWNNYNGIDGMPATISEFYDLLTRIRKKGYSAFIFSTGVQYTRVIQAAVQAQVDGLDTYYDLFSDYTGWYDFNEDGIKTNDEIITPNTAYKLLDTRGYKAAVEMALKMFEKTSGGKTFYDPAVPTGVSFGVAQQDFLMSKETSQPIAMLFEGEWWENEARATFNAMGEVNEENAYGKREFRMMPIPSFNSTNEEQKYTLGAWTGGAVTIVNEKTVAGNRAKEKVAELWLQYQYSDKGLRCFTSHNGATLPFDYELSDEEFAKLTPFGRNVWELKHSDEVEIVYDSPMMRSREVRLGTQLFDYHVTIGNEYKGHLFNNYVTFCQEEKNVSVAEYLKGMHDYYDTKFASAYAKA